MPKGDKFIALTAYLEKCGMDEVKMTFSEIEKIIGFRLSDSAYTYPAQWSNSESQSFAFGWLNAGYITRQVNIPQQTVEFVKSPLQKQQRISDRTRTTTEKRIAINSAEAKNAITKNAGVNNTVSNRAAILPVEEAIRCIRTYYNESVIDPHGRYLSWRHCYNAFSENRNSPDESTMDYLALHLAFYLASWGMYRGSSFLLQKDYKVHTPVVKIIIEKRYDRLMGISAEELIKDENLTLLEEVSGRIRRAYADERPSFEGMINNATDTLVTKILLGTLGCVPAYDRYYVQAVRRYKISVGEYCRDSVKAVANYYLTYKDRFETVREELSACGTQYPAMKLMDMCMWQAAFEMDNE